MQSAITFSSKEDFQKAVLDVVKQYGLVPENSNEGRHINLTEFCEKYCKGKSKNWVKEEIFYKYKPDWVKDIHPGHGRRFIISELKAARWMEKHDKELNW